MQALVCSTPGKLEYKQIPEPKPELGRSILKIRRIGICGTDLHAFQGTQPFFNYPRILGHELSGELLGGNAGAYTIMPYYSCGHCIACLQGKPNCCSSIKVCGVHVDGGMVEYLSVPDSALIAGEGLSLDALALVEPLSIGAHGVRRAAIQPGEYVLVMGAGPIGLGTMAFASIAGAKVIVLDVNEQRLDFCRKQMGVTHTVLAISEAVTVDDLRHITAGQMPTVVIDCTGNLGAIQHGLSYLAHGGRYVLIGLQKASFSFSHPEFHKRETTLMSSRNATRDDFTHVMQAMRAGLVDPLTFITHKVPFDKAGKEFKHWLDPAKGVIKAMIEL
jgi:2-desacetyl-2-hydroxyethyl bacteriochlorophyllide A dehydrogenase